MMNHGATIDLFGTLIRVALLVVVLFSPLVAIQTVQAGSSTIIEGGDTPKKGIGFVLLTSLHRV